MDNKVRMAKQKVTCASNPNMPLWPCTSTYVDYVDVKPLAQVTDEGIFTAEIFQQNEVLYTNLIPCHEETFHYTKRSKNGRRGA